MHLAKVPFSKTRSFSDSFLDYIQQKDSLGSFYSRFPTPRNFLPQITEKQKSFPAHNRQVLVQSLQEQYKDIQTTEAVTNNISLLQHNTTFTVTTGHQLNIFTGPLYFIYKIVTAINACKQLKQQYPSFDFVPVYWMASEDHDYDEIKSFRLYGKKYTWITDQQGAVGRFSTLGLETILKELPGDITPFSNAYLKHKTLSNAVRYYVNELFKQEGLIVMDADNRALKSLFKEVMKKDIINTITKQEVDKTNASLEALGYETQVYCRNINFFYLDTQLRSRLEQEGNQFNVVDTTISFSKEAMLDVIEQTPEKISPNVILRPLYQEMILPNLAYIGGPAEVTYWLQLKGLFDYHNIPFPILMPRNFALVIDHTLIRKFEKTGLELVDLFEDKNNLFNHWIHKHSSHNISVASELAAVQALYNDLVKRAGAIDHTLVPFVNAEATRVTNSLEKIEKKMLRAEKRVQSEKLGQIEAIKDALFPNGGLQERIDNFLNFYQADKQFIQKLLQLFDPFDFQFNILIEEQAS